MSALPFCVHLQALKLLLNHVGGLVTSVLYIVCMKHQGFIVKRQWQHCMRVADAAALYRLGSMATRMWEGRRSQSPATKY
jgi:hypothetical protein